MAKKAKVRLPRCVSGKEPACQCRRHKRGRLDSWIGKIPGRRKWQPTPVFLSGESHGERNLTVCGPPDHKELDMTEATKACMKKAKVIYL